MEELIFLVEEDPTGGFTARALGVSIFTEADTREALLANIREAVSCHFEGTGAAPKMVRLHYVRDEVFAL
jgi:hypothetical protein